jgi:hypothetical protein
VFAAGGKLVRDIARAGFISSNELDNINIAVNAKVTSEERSIGDIATAISAIQKIPLNVPAGAPTGTTQGGRAGARLFTSGVEARLRRSIELVTTWVALYNNTVTATAANLVAAQCPSKTAGSPLQAQPIVIVTNGQNVTVTPGGQDNSSGSGSVFTVQIPPQPPPHPIRRKAPLPSASTGPFAVITLDDEPGLRTGFALAPTETAFPSSANFQRKVRVFQACRGEPTTGRLSPAQKSDALAGADICLPKNKNPVGQPPAPGGGSRAQPPPPGKH